jgi:2-polyprenyl-3-methyl-5-hydroxy-6-metoxy-1,4-benzoquinol methylase
MKLPHYEHAALHYSVGSLRANRVARLVGGPSLRVLDVACGSGHLGAVLRAQGNYVEGIEISSQASEKARAVLDAVHTFDIENPWPRLPVAAFDVVVLGEIVEHVFDPVALLRNTRAVLKDNGSIVLTTPNFMAWIHRLQFLFGRFRYQQHGTFDFGHIRWFTYDYLREVLNDAGFELTEEAHITRPQAAEPIVARWPSLFAQQFVVKAHVRS